MNEPARQQFPDPAPNERAGAASRPRRTAAAPPPDSIEEILAQTDKIRAESARAAAEHNRAMAEYAREAAERDRALDERCAQIKKSIAEGNRKAEERRKEMLKSIVIIVGVAGGLITAILGGFIAVLEFRDKDTDLAAILAATSAPTSPAVVQYLSPQSAQPPADSTPAN